MCAQYVAPAGAVGAVLNFSNVNVRWEALCHWLLEGQYSIRYIGSTNDPIARELLHRNDTKYLNGRVAQWMANDSFFYAAVADMQTAETYLLQLYAYARGNGFTPPLNEHATSNQPPGLIGWVYVVFQSQRSVQLPI